MARKCQSKNPSQCAVHGVGGKQEQLNISLNEALATQDFSKAVELRQEIDSLFDAVSAKDQDKKAFFGGRNKEVVPFSKGQRVACYSGEVLSSGVIIRDDGLKVTIAMEWNVTNDIHTFEYIRRESDGLVVAAESRNERVPTWMISSMEDIDATNKWRYYPSPIEKLKRKFSK